MVGIAKSIAESAFLKASKGTLYRQGEMYWFAVRIDGKRYYKALKTNRKEMALKLSRELTEQLAAGINPFVIEKRSTHFHDFCREYLAFSQATKSPRSYERDIGIIKKLTGRFRADLSSITRADIERYLERSCRGMAPGTVNKELQLIHALMRKAVERGYLESNPATGIKKLLEQPKDIPRVTNEAIEKILQAADPAVYAAAIKVMLETGVRLGELLRLRWSDVNLAQEQIKVVDTKTKQHRYVPISGRLRAVLAEIPKAGDTLFAVSDHRMKHKVSLICKAAGYRNITAHTFRHEYCSRLVEAGVDLRKVQELAGHRRIQTTMRYLHLAPGYMKGLGDKLGYRFKTGA